MEGEHFAWLPKWHAYRQSGAKKSRSMKEFIFRKIPKYYLVSALSVGVNFGVFWLLIQSDVNYVVAIVISFAIEATVAYLLNRFWTFNNTLISFEIGYMRSFLVAALNLFLILILSIAGVEVLNFDYLVSRIIAGVIVGIVGFILDAGFSFAVWPDGRKNFSKD